MFRILILLIAGAGIGFLTRNQHFTQKTEKYSQLVVCMLLFVFGASLGSDRTLLGNFGNYGYHALTIALLGVAGSLIAAMVAQRLFFRKGGQS